MSRGRVALRPVGIADHAGEIADQERDLVAELLELAQLVDEHRVAQMQIGRGRIKARLDTQRHAAAELAFEVRERQHLGRRRAAARRAARPPVR